MLDLKASRAELHAADNRAARPSRNRVPEIVKPKIEFRLDNFVDQTPSTERRYVERREDVAKEYEEFLVGYTKKLIDMRNSLDPATQQVWNSKFAQVDRMLLQELLGEKTDFGGVPGEADQATRAKVQDYIKTNRGWAMATDALVRHAKESYRVQGLSVSREDTQVATETRTFTRGVPTGREGLKNFINRKRWELTTAGTLVAEGAATGAVAGILVGGSERSTAIGALAGGAAVLGTEVGGYLARHKLARGLKYVRDLWEGDQRVRYNSEVLRSLQSNPTEAAYAKAITGIDVTALTPTATGVEGLPVEKTNALNEAARKNLESVKKFYKSLGIEADPLISPQKLTINKRAHEIFETRVGSLARQDKWGQDASNVCYLRKDCGVMILSTTAGEANVDDIFKRVQQVREGRARGALPTNTYLDTTVTPPVPLSDTSVAEIFAAAQMERVDVTTGLAPHFAPNQADILLARQNIAQGIEAKRRIDAGLPVMTDAEKWVVRQRAVPQDVKNYFLDLPTAPPPTPAQIQAVIQENAAREEEIFRLQREAHATAISDVGMEMIKNNPPRSQTVESAIGRLQTRQGEIQKGTGTEIQKLEGQKASIQVNEDAVNLEITEHIQPLETARAEIKRLEDQGVNERGVARSGDFATNIDSAISSVDARLKGTGVKQRLEAATSDTETFVAKSQEEEQARKALGRQIGQMTLTGDGLITAALTEVTTVKTSIAGIDTDIQNLEQPSEQSKIENVYYTQYFVAAGSPASGTKEEAKVRADARTARDGHILRQIEYFFKKHQNLQSQIPQIQEQMTSYEAARHATQSAQEKIVRPASDTYDLYQAREERNNLITVPGAPVTEDKLRNSRVGIDQLTDEVEADRKVNPGNYSKFLAGPPPATIEQVKRMITRARTEQIMQDTFLDAGSDTNDVAAFDKTLFAPAADVTGKRLTTWQIINMDDNAVDAFLEGNLSGWTKGTVVGKEEIKGARREAQKRLRNRYKPFLETQQAAQAEVNEAELIEKKTKLTELKTNYATAKLQLAEAENRAVDASAGIDIAKTKDQYDEWFTRQVIKRTTLTERDFQMQTIDKLTEEVKSSIAAGRLALPRHIIALSAEQRDAWIRDQLSGARTEYFARLIQASTEVSLPSQDAAYRIAIDTPRASITTKELFTGLNDEQLIDKLIDPKGVYFVPGLTPPIRYTKDQAKEVLHSARVEAGKRRRIRYEVALREQLKDYQRQRGVLDEQIRTLQEEQQKKVPEIETLQTMMSNYDRLPQAAFDMVSNIDKYTALTHLNKAVDLNRTEAEYAISSSAATPRSYLEFLDLVMNCGNAGDRNACFVEGHKLLNEQAMADRMIATLPLLDTARNRLATGTSIQDTIESLERGVKGGQINPKHLHDFLVSTIEDFAKRAGTL